MTRIIERARAFFGHAMEGVEVVLGVHPAAPEALGSVLGRRVYLHPGCVNRQPEEALFVLGHELAHVVQQRQGRVAATGIKSGVPLNDSPALEAEADAIGRSFALGIRHRQGNGDCYGGALGSWPSPVLQCLIAIGNRRIGSAAELSPKGQAVLELIPHGQSWLKGMTDAPPRYVFEDEADLLAGIQVGLHGSETLLLRRLGVLVHPQRLQALDPDELDGLLAIERSPVENVVNLRKTRKALTRHGVWSESELAIGDEFLRTAGVSGEPVFRSLSLSDRIALFDLVNEASTALALNPMLQREAAAFAAAHAQSSPEFIDYYQFYMAQIADKDPLPQLAGRRARFAEAAAETLSDLLFDLLWSPNFSKPPTAAELPAALLQWSGRGYRLGFPRLSAALAHIAQYAELHGASGPSARQLINRYMERAQNHWLQRTPGAVQFSQDGRYRDYVYDLPNAQAILRLDADGSLTIGPLRSAASAVQAGMAGGQHVAAAPPGPATAAPKEQADGEVEREQSS